jgi:hypothetical protein
MLRRWQPTTFGPRQYYSQVHKALNDEGGRSNTADLQRWREPAAKLANSNSQSIEVTANALQFQPAIVST